MTRATPTLLIIHALGRSTQGVTTCPLPWLLSLPLCVCATHLAIWPQLQLEIYVFLARHKLRRKRDSCVERTPTARLGQCHLPALLLAAAACHTKIAQSSASINNNNAADGAGETGKETDPRLETGDSRKQIQIPLARSAARAEQSSPAHCNPFRVAQATCAADVATGNQLRRRRRLQELLLLSISPSSLLPLPVNKKQSKVRRTICKLQVAMARGKVKEIAANSGNISWRAAAWLPNAANCESRQ